MVKKNYDGDISKLFRNLSDLTESIVPNKSNQVNIGDKDKLFRNIYSDTLVTNNIKLKGDIYFKNNYKLCVKNNALILRTLRTDRLPKMIADYLSINNLNWEDGVPDKSINDVLNRVPQLTDREWEGLYLDIVFSNDNLDTDEEIDQFKLLEEDFYDIDIDVILNHKSFIFNNDEKYTTDWKIMQLSGKLSDDIPIIELSKTYKTSKVFGVMNDEKKL